MGTTSDEVDAAIRGEQNVVKGKKQSIFSYAKEKLGAVIAKNKAQREMYSQEYEKEHMKSEAARARKEARFDSKQKFEHHKKKGKFGDAFGSRIPFSGLGDVFSGVSPPQTPGLPRKKKGKNSGDPFSIF